MADKTTCVMFRRILSKAAFKLVKNYDFMYLTRYDILFARGNNILSRNGIFAASVFCCPKRRIKWEQK